MTYSYAHEQFARAGAWMASTRSSTMGMSSTMYQQDVKKHTGKALRRTTHEPYAGQPMPSKHKTCISSHNTAHRTCAVDMGAARIHEILLPPAQQGIGGSKALEQELAHDALAHDARQMRIFITQSSLLINLHYYRRGRTTHGAMGVKCVAAWDSSREEHGECMCGGLMLTCWSARVFKNEQQR